MKNLVLLLFLRLWTADVRATTHWLVTETGLIQPRVDSPFEMARPYDLLAFLNQDTRWDNVKKLYNELSKRQVDINNLWSEIETETDINTWLSNDENCKKTGLLQYLDWYVTRLEDGLTKHIAEEDFQLYDPSFGEDADVPDCKKISSLTFSMFAFEHLEAMVNRDNLSVAAELSLPELIAPVMTVEQFGHWVTSVLRRNSSSWLHYNMASLFWRVRGNAPKALECSRRAVHYSPREYKDIALLSMGTVLHRARRSEDAVTVLNAAVDHDPQCIEAHFVLGHAYAVLGEWNSSLKHYDETLKLNSGYDQAIKNKYGVYCVMDMIKKMRGVHKKLMTLKTHLEEYDGKDTLLFKIQAAFLRNMKHNEEIDFRNVDKIFQKMSEITGLNMKDLKKKSDRNSVILYFLGRPHYKDSWFAAKDLSAIDAAASVRRLIRHITNHADVTSHFVVRPDQVVLSLSTGSVKKELGPLPAMPELGTRDWLSKTARYIHINTDTPSADKDKANSKPDDESYEFELGIPLYPSTMKVSRSVEEFDRDPDWPSEKVCIEAPSSPDENMDAIYPVFLPFENKGLRLKGLLTDRIGVGVHAEHELPWHPPVCPSAKEAANILKKAVKLTLVPEIRPTDYLNEKLLEYVGDGYPDQVAHMQDAEIGQRIYSAMHSNVAPNWLVYTLASLYWRVRGKSDNAFSCLLAASKNVRVKYKDVVLTSLASVYLEMGLFDEALLAAEEAYKLGPYEPATNFLLSQLHMIKKQMNSQMFHLKQTLRVDPGYLRGVARTLLEAWACLYKQVTALQDFEFSEGDVCTEVGPGVSMVCNKGNVNCHVANIHCFTHSEKDSTSTFVRLTEVKDDCAQLYNIDTSVFEPIIQNMPLERTDKEGHDENLQKMVAIMDQLRGCEPKGCSNIKAEELGLKGDDCTYQYLQLGYWLHITSFRQLITDNDLRLPPEILAQRPTAKKVPECRIYGDPAQDPFLSRLMKVSAEGWEVDMTLMQQLSDIFQNHDYVTLGAKFAKYIDTQPRSWTGALCAGWWCGAGGRGACALRCLAAAYALAPVRQRLHALRSLSAMLHMQGKTKDAVELAHLTFYMAPTSKAEAFLVALSYTYQAQYEQAVWMYRYALSIDNKYLPAKACLHATMCIILYGEAFTKQGKSQLDI